MAGNELEGLMEGFVEGVLTPEQTLRLKTLLERDPDRADELASMMEMEGLLDRLGERQSVGEADARERLLYMLDARLEGGAKLARKVLERANAGIRRRNQRLRLIGVAAAAALLLLAGGILFLPDAETNPPEEKPSLVVSEPVPEEDKAVVEPPPVPKVEAPVVPEPKPAPWKAPETVPPVKESVADSGAQEPRVAEKPKVSEPRESKAALARLSEVEGLVEIIEEEFRRPARANEWLLSDQGVVSGSSGGVSLDFPDGTNVRVMADTEIASVTQKPGKSDGRRETKLAMKRGKVRVDSKSDFGVDTDSISLSSGDSRFSFRHGRVSRLEVVEGEVMFAPRAQKPIRVTSGMTAGRVPAGVFCMPKGMNPEEALKEAIVVGNHAAAGNAAKAILSGDPAAGAKLLCSALLDCGSRYQEQLTLYLALMKKMIHIHNNSKSDPGKKTHAEFDGLMEKQIPVSFLIEDLERCAIAIAEAFKGVSSEEAFKEMVKACRKASSVKLGDYLVEALGYMTHPGVEAEMLRIVKRSSEKWRVKVAAIDALGLQKSETSRKELNRLLSSKDGRLRRAAQTALTGQAVAKQVASGGRGATFYEMRVDCEAAVFVIDISNSMVMRNGTNRAGKTVTRLEVLKEELSYMLRDLPDGFNMNIIPYSSIVWTMVPEMTVLTRGTRPAIQKYINELDNSIMTSISDALQVGFLVVNGEWSGSTDVVTGRGNRKAVDTIFFMTDGKPFVMKKYRDFDKGDKTNTGKIISRVKLWNRRARVRVNTVAIGEGKGEWLSDLAKQNRGEHTAK